MIITETMGREKSFMYTIDVYFYSSLSITAFSCFLHDECLASTECVLTSVCEVEESVLILVLLVNGGHERGCLRNDIVDLV